ncbi:MAG: DNA repair protein RecO [Chloroflexi bacterium]|jgi:DNA repair protein RecO (recombination protein O)|nr:MAG: DNA repair protein RecO [Chloroflexota bacterium]RLT29952.1 MAG: DNA repair protein RecO [Chloroflexota bacterium]
MALRRTSRITGVVTSRFRLGEADRVLTLLSPERGKFKAIAKGVRKPSSRLGGGVEPFAELHLGLASGRTFDVVTQVQSARVWLGLRGRLGSSAVAWYAAELVERATSEEQPEPALYDLLLRAWDLLESGAADLLVARWTELGILDAAGHGPELDACLDCSRAPLEGEELRWDAEAGGIRCATHGEGAPLSSDALRLLRALRRFAPEELAALRLPAAALLEVDRALRGSILALYGREPRSRSFLDEVMA